MDIGNPIREIEFEPLTEPVEAPVQEPEPVRVPEPEKEPVGV